MACPATAHPRQCVAGTSSSHCSAHLLESVPWPTSLLPSGSTLAQAAAGREEQVISHERGDCWAGLMAGMRPSMLIQPAGTPCYLMYF